MSDDRLRARIEASIDRDPVFGCHLWRARTDRDGYGVMWGRGGPRQAHRVAYIELAGPIAAGLVLDHLCRRRRCVRTAHLEPITGAENDLRRSWAYRARRQLCPRGHSLSTAIVTPEGGRLCRTCMGPERAPMHPPLTVTPNDMEASRLQPDTFARADVVLAAAKPDDVPPMGVVVFGPRRPSVFGKRRT